MVQVLRFNKNFANPEETFLQLRVVDVAREVLKLNGKVRILHLARERFLETALLRNRAVDVQFSAGKESRSEEWKPLNMIPVRVTDQKMNTMRTGPAQHVQAKHSNAGAGIEHKCRPVHGAQFHTRGIAAIGCSPMAWRRDRATRSPEPYVHQDTLSQIVTSLCILLRP